MTQHSPDPADRLSVYKQLVDVPERYRLVNFSTEFEGQDTWAEFVAARAREVGGELSESREKVYDRSGRAWKEFMAERDRHHALADPDHIEAFVADLDAELAVSTTYESYFSPLTNFYGWLWHHADYPHVYSPVLMAANNGGISREYWDYRMGID